MYLSSTAFAEFKLRLSASQQRKTKNNSEQPQKYGCNITYVLLHNSCFTLRTRIHTCEYSLIGEITCR